MTFEARLWLLLGWDFYFSFLVLCPASEGLLRASFSLSVFNCITPHSSRDAHHHLLPVLRSLCAPTSPASARGRAQPGAPAGAAYGAVWQISAGMKPRQPAVAGLHLPLGTGTGPGSPATGE